MQAVTWWSSVAYCWPTIGSSGANGGSPSAACGWKGAVGKGWACKSEAACRSRSKGRMAAVVREPLRSCPCAKAQPSSSCNTDLDGRGLAARRDDRAARVQEAAVQQVHTAWRGDRQELERRGVGSAVLNCRPRHV